MRHKTGLHRTESFPIAEAAGGGVSSDLRHLLTHLYRRIDDSKQDLTPFISRQQ
jgi:hypothetical protein